MSWVPTIPARSPYATALHAHTRLLSATMKPSPCTSRSLKTRPAPSGKDHPHTLTTLNNIAYTYRSVGRLPEAITLYEQVMKEQIRVLGEDHPGTYNTRRELADSYREAGRTDESIALYEQLLVSSQRVLGDDHPFTMAMCEELGDVRRELKQRDNPSAD